MREVGMKNYIYLFQLVTVFFIGIHGQAEGMKKQKNENQRNNKNNNNKKRKKIKETSPWVLIQTLTRDQFLNLCIGKNKSDALSFDTAFQILEQLSDEQFEATKQNGLLKFWVEKSAKGENITGELKDYCSIFKKPLFTPITINIDEPITETQKIKIKQFMEKFNYKNNLDDREAIIENNRQEVDPSSNSDSDSDKQINKRPKKKNKHNKKTFSHAIIEKDDMDDSDNVQHKCFSCGRNTEVFFEMNKFPLCTECYEKQKQLEKDSELAKEFQQQYNQEQQEFERSEREKIEREKIEREKQEREQENEQIESECPICFGSMEENNFVETPCHHKFHEGCIKDWFNRSTLCPMCNQETGGKIENTHNKNQVQQSHDNPQQVDQQPIQNNNENNLNNNNNNQDNDQGGYCIIF